MTLMKKPGSSGSEVDDRKRRRMISNRESARRSRMRKQQQLEGLANQADRLKRENEAIVEKVNEVADIYVCISSENNVLRAQLAELADRLGSLNSVLQIADAGVPETLIEPWQLPCPASTRIFQC